MLARPLLVFVLLLAWTATSFAQRLPNVRSAPVVRTATPSYNSSASFPARTYGWVPRNYGYTNGFVSTSNISFFSPASSLGVSFFSPTVPASSFPNQSYYGFGRNRGGFVPFYSGFYNPQPTIVNNYITITPTAPAPVMETPVPTFRPADAPPPLPADDSVARLTLRVPANAEVIVNGEKSQQTSLQQTFESPELAENQQYTFAVKVSWSEGKKTVKEERSVIVDVGKTRTLMFFALPSRPVRLER